VLSQGGGEFQILLAPCNVLGNGEIIHLETQAGDATRVGILDAHKPALPAGGKCGGARPYALRIISKGLMKGGALTDAPVDQIGAILRMERIDVCFHRGEQSSGRPRELAQYRLAAHDDDFSVIRDRACGAK